MQIYIALLYYVNIFSHAGNHTYLEHEIELKCSHACRQKVKFLLTIIKMIKDQQKCSNTF